MSVPLTPSATVFQGCRGRRWGYGIVELSAARGPPDDSSGIEARYRRGVQHISAGSKDRAMTRTVPAILEAVPVQMTTEVGACRGMLVNMPLGIAVGGNLLQSLADDRTLAGL
jgi:hypothetical protein